MWVHFQYLVPHLHSLLLVSFHQQDFALAVVVVGFLGHEGDGAVDGFEGFGEVSFFA